VRPTSEEASARWPNPSAQLRAVAETYVRLLQDHLGDALVSAVLFGSVARGEAGPHSDIDLLVVVKGLPPSRLARHACLDAADSGIEPTLRSLRSQGILTDVQPVLKTPEEAERISPLYLDLVEDAVLLFDRGGFFAEILGRLRASLARLGARRVRRGRFWYWDLKPDYRFGEVFEV
jgi:predicted nucleotidyltransferase